MAANFGLDGLTAGQRWTAGFGLALALGMVGFGLPSSSASDGEAGLALPSPAVREAGLVRETPAAAVASSDVPPLPALQPASELGDSSTIPAAPEPSPSGFESPAEPTPEPFSPEPASPEPTPEEPPAEPAPAPAPTPTLPVPVPVPVPPLG